MSSISSIIHDHVIERAKEKLAADGSFIKEEVTAEFNPPEIADAIHWPKVRAAAGEALGQELMNVTETPVDANGKPYDPELYPEKYLPSGRRPTIGYATMAATPPRVVIAAVERRVNMALGSLRGAERLALAAEKEGLPITYNRQPLPTLQIGAPAAE